MSTPSTKTLDHIVHLAPLGTLKKVSKQFRDLGFNVIPGGSHVGGLSENALVIFGDGVYLELFTFVDPALQYPPGWTDIPQRPPQPWDKKQPGWIDFAFLGTGTSLTSISRIINARAAKDGSGISYNFESVGGRTREDFKIIEWMLTTPKDDRLRGVVPFFCGDCTPRELRVPTQPPSNTVHPSGAQGVAYVRVLAKPESIASISAQLTSVIGDPPQSSTPGSKYTWTLETPLSTSSVQKPRLILSAPVNDEERDHLDTKGPGIFEVGLSVGKDGIERESRTPYGKIVWLRPA